MAKRLIEIPKEVNVRLKAIAEAKEVSVMSVILRLLDSGSKKEYPAARRKLNKIARG